MYSQPDFFNHSNKYMTIQNDYNTFKKRNTKIEHQQNTTLIDIPNTKTKKLLKLYQNFS